MQSTIKNALTKQEKQALFQKALLHFEEEAISFINKNNLTFNPLDEKEIISFFKKLVFLKYLFFTPDEILKKALSFYQTPEKRQAYLEASFTLYHHHKKTEDKTISAGVKGRKKINPYFPPELKDGDLYIPINAILPLPEQIEDFIKSLNEFLPDDKKFFFKTEQKEDQTKFYILQKNKTQTLGRFLTKKIETLKALIDFLTTFEEAPLFYDNFSQILSANSEYNPIKQTPNGPIRINWFKSLKKTYQLSDKITLDETLFYVFKKALADKTLEEAISFLNEMVQKFDALNQKVSYLQTTEQKHQDKSKKDTIDTMVFTINPRSLARMSAYVSWEKDSCMNPNGCNHNFVAEDISHGTILVYGINAQNPYKKICRLLLKPYKGEKGDIYYHTGKTYGLFTKEFALAVTEYVNTHFNHPKSSIFRTNTALYQDNQPRVIALTSDIEEYYNALEINYSHFMNGDKKHYIVNEDIYLEHTTTHLDFSTTSFTKDVVYNSLIPPKKLPFYANNLYFVGTLMDMNYDFTRVDELSFISSIVKNLPLAEGIKKVTFTSSTITEDNKKLKLKAFKSEFTNIIFQNISSITLEGIISSIHNPEFQETVEIDASNLEGFCLTQLLEKDILKISSLTLPKKTLSLKNISIDTPLLNDTPLLERVSITSSILSDERIITPQDIFILKNTTFSNLKELNLQKIKTNIDFFDLDLSLVQEILWPQNNLKSLSFTKITLPNIDIYLDQVEKAYLSNCNLSAVQKITPSTFAFTLKECQLSPLLTEVDFKNTYITEIEDTDLSHLKSITFGRITKLNNTKFSADFYPDFSTSYLAKLSYLTLNLCTKKLPQKELIVLNSTLQTTEDTLDLSHLSRVVFNGVCLPNVKKIIAPRIFEITETTFDKLEEIDFSNCRQLIIKKTDLSQVKIHLNKIKKASLLSCKLPLNIKFTRCENIILNHSTFVSNSETNLDLSGINSASLDSCNLSTVSSIRPPKENVSFISVRFPRSLTELDLSTCQRADLTATHLLFLKTFKAPKKFVNLSMALLPEELDLSGTKKASMQKTNLENIKMFKPPFRYLDLTESVLPNWEELDLSSCSSVNLYFTRVQPKRLILKEYAGKNIHKALCGKNVFKLKRASFINRLIHLFKEDGHVNQ